jgi:hypothetical protein
MKLILHRGLRIVRENSIMSIVFPLSRGVWVEFDTCYIRGEWRLCHDHGSCMESSERLTDLVDLLLRRRSLCKGVILLDVKWDEVANRNDNIEDIMMGLSDLLAPLRDSLSLWIQVSDPRYMRFFDAYEKRGYIVRDTDDIDPSAHFLTIDLTAFTLEDVRAFHQSKKVLIGFTCASPKVFHRYRHFAPFLTALVYDP